MHALREASRHVLRNPLDTLLACLSFAAGIGFAGVVFSLANAFFLGSLPAEKPDELTIVYGLDASNPGFLPVSFLNYEDVARQQTSFRELAAYQWAGANLVGSEVPTRLTGQIVSDAFFQMLGVRPTAGREFAPNDQDTVILADTLATRLFGDDPTAAIGSTVVLNREPFVVLGVAPAGFVGVGAMGMAADFWVPMNAFRKISRFGSYLDVRRARMFGLVGRLRPEVTIDTAQGELSILASNLRSSFPEANQGLEFAVRPINESILDPNKRDRFVLASQLLALLGALLLAMVCANVSNLLLIQAGRRAKDHAIAQALGEGVGRMARRTLSESLLLAAVGGGLGTALTILVQHLLWRNRPPSISEESFQVGFDARIAAFILCTVLVTGLISSLGPILVARRTDLATALKMGPEATGARVPRFGARDLLVALQIAVALTSVAAVGLFVRSLDRATRFDLGVATERLALFRYDLQGEVAEPEGRLSFGRRLVERLESLPGVASASLAAFPPLNPFLPLQSFETDHQAVSGSSAPAYPVNAVGAGYFQTTGITLLEGRAFDDSDRADTARVAVVNQTLAQRYWSPTQAVGQRFRLGAGRIEIRVVGVVADSVFGGIGDEIRPVIFVPLAQDTPTRLTLHVRSVGTPAPLLQSVPRTFEHEAPNVPLTDVETLEARLHETLWAPRLTAVSVAVVGLASVILAIAGVYGTVAASLRPRRREIGIRIAMGGTPKRVTRDLLLRTTRGVALGLILGLTLTVTALRLTRNLLFGISPLDPTSLAVAVSLVALTSLFAATVPIVLAVRSDPIAAIRQP